MRLGQNEQTAQDFEGTIEEKIEHAHYIIDNHTAWKNFLNTLNSIIAEAQNCNDPNIVEASEKLQLKINQEK